MSVRLGEILLRAGLVDALQLRSAMAHQQQWGGRLPKIVVEKRMAREEDVIQALAKALRIQTVTIALAERDAAALDKVSGEYAREKGLLPLTLKDNGKTLWVAMADPSDIPTIDELSIKAHARIVPLLCGETEIQTEIDRVYFGKEPEKAPVAYGALAPADPGEGFEDEGKVVDFSGRTLIKNIKDLNLDALKKAPAQPAAVQRFPAPAAPAGDAASLLDDLLGPASAPALTEEQLARARAVQEQQDKSARLIRALLELCVEKGLFKPDEYRSKLAKG